MNNKDIIIPMLRLVIPGDHDPTLDFYGKMGPKGGNKIVCPQGAFNPKDGYLTRLIRGKNTGIRHGFRGFWEKSGHIKEFTLFSITLPDDPVVRTICRRPWRLGLTSSHAWKAAQIGNLHPMMDEIKTITLKEYISRANGNI